MYFFKKRLVEDSSKKEVDLAIVNKETKWWKPLLLMGPTLILILLFTIIPFLAAATDAFQTTPDRNDPLKRVASFEQFSFLFRDPAFHKALSNSLLYAFISVPLTMFIAIIISAALSNLLRKTLKGFFQTLFFLPYITSAVAIGLAFAYLFDADTGLLNKILGQRVPWLTEPEGNSALKAMLIYGVWRGIAFNVLIYTSAMLSVDRKLYKSASIDGAGPIKQFFAITLPSISRTTTFLLTIGVIGAIKVFPLALFKNNPQDALDNGGSTLLIYIYAKLQVSHNYMLAGAASLMILVVSILFSFSVRKGLSLTINLVNMWKEKNVENKIKASRKVF